MRLTQGLHVIEHQSSVRLSICHGKLLHHYRDLLPSCHTVIEVATPLIGLSDRRISLHGRLERPHNYAGTVQTCSLQADASMQEQCRPALCSLMHLWMQTCSLQADAFMQEQCKLALCRQMHTDDISRDEYVYHHLLAGMSKAGKHDLILECLDWMRADNIKSGSHLYTVSLCSLTCITHSGVHPFLHWSNRFMHAVH